MAGALETHIASIDDSLIDGMSFGNRPTASYVTARRSTAFQPVSGGVFAPNALRIIRFSINDNDGSWLDGSTLRLALVLSNTCGALMYPSTLSPASLFRRLRVLVGGVEVADTQDYGRVHEMFGSLLPAQRKAEDAIEGWGSVYGVQAGAAGSPGPQATLTNPFAAFPLAPGTSRRMLTQLLCPFFSQGKFLPLSLSGPVTLELELGDFQDCFITQSGVAPVTWSILQPEILCDTLSVDPSLSNSYASSLLSGKSLPISYHNFFSFQSTIANHDAVSIPCQRGFSRLVCLYFTLTRADQQFNTFFYAPMEANDPTTDNDTFRWSTQLGGDKQPTYDCRSLSETFYRLRKAQNIFDGTDSFGLTFRDYCFDNFIAAACFERAPGSGATHSGQNTMGQNLVLNLYHLGPHAATVHIVAHYDCVLSITSGGCELAY